MATMAPTPNADKWFVGRETAATLIDVSTRTIDDAIRSGQLEAFRLGRRVLISRTDLMEFVQRVSAGPFRMNRSN
jgi:excisionase family DNA binding protein